jgi:drug/metabolite transporter (DMT)-like permease
MVWFILSVLTAFFESMKDISSKRSLRNIDEYIVSLSLTLFALPFLIPFLFFIKIPHLGNQFWMALFLGGGLNIIATILYMKAIKYSDLSISVPMVAFTPLFLLVTSPLMLNEFPRSFGLVGIVLIVAGSYILNIKEKRRGYIAPFRALLKEKGSKLMLIVAFIWSITSNFDKVGVQNSSPIFWIIAIDTFIALVMAPIVFYKSRRNINQISADLIALIPIGLFGALTAIFQMKAITLTYVAYVISIKRTSAIISVLSGHLIFNEKGIEERLIGALTMILGVLFITLS